MLMVDPKHSYIAFRILNFLWRLESALNSFWLQDVKKVFHSEVLKNCIICIYLGFWFKITFNHIIQSRFQIRFI